MSNLALVFTLVFIILTIILSLWQKVGLEKDVIIGTIRAAIQLIAIGYVLHLIFAEQRWYFIAFMVGVMILVAALNARKKWNNLKGITLRIILTLTITELITMGLILILGIIEAKAETIIPVSGMIIGNGMVSVGLFLNRLKADLHSRMDEINIHLALGASSKQAMRMIKKDVVKASLLPIIDGMKTVGLVQLPGLMTGMIIAGASPIEAVRYQLLIMYSLTASTALVSMILAISVHQLLFNQAHQFKGSETLQ